LRKRKNLALIVVKENRLPCGRRRCGRGRHKKKRMTSKRENRDNLHEWRIETSKA